MLWICTDCTTAYSVGAPKCPQCASTTFVELGSAEHEQWLAARNKPAAKVKNVKEGGSE